MDSKYFVNTEQDVYFVVEPESALEKPKKGREAPAPVSTTATAYRLDIDLLQKADEFDQQDGQYSLQLVVGDALLAQSGLTWQLADFNLHFPKFGDVKPAKLVLSPVHLCFCALQNMYLVFITYICTEHCSMYALIFSGA